MIRCERPLISIHTQLIPVHHPHTRIHNQYVQSILSLAELPRRSLGSPDRRQVEQMELDRAMGSSCKQFFGIGDCTEGSGFASRGDVDGAVLAREEESCLKTNTIIASIEQELAKSKWISEGSVEVRTQ